MKTTPLESKIAEIVRPVAADLGLEVVSVRLIGEGGGRNLQIMAENPQTRNLGLEDCTKLSKAVSAVLDVEDPIEGAYRLEVSSPGIDRVLTRLQDFDVYNGFEVKIELDSPSSTGQKRFKGRIGGLKGETITIITDQGEIEFPFGIIQKAKLVLTDDLIKATANS